MEYHNNTVYFEVNSDSHCTLVGGSFTIDGASVSSGQDPNHYIYPGMKTQMGSDGSLNFRIGRHGTSEVANWWEANIPGSKNTFGHDPGKLNFAMIGTLELIFKAPFWKDDVTVTFDRIGLAQGHAGSSNNWWFGGTYCAHGDGNTVATSTATGPDGKAYKFLFRRGDNSVSQVVVRPYFEESWMALVDDSVQLDQIMMPGSHDSGMSVTSHCAPPVGADTISQTQSLGIGGQLQAGVRYFDIRVDYDHGGLVTYHRSGQWGCNGQSVEGVINQAGDFIQSRTTETAILAFSHTRDYDGHNPSEIKRLLDELIQRYPDQSILFKSDNESVNLAELTLGEVRGKLILMFEYEEAYITPSTGRFHYRYIDNGQPLKGVNLSLYDNYSDTDDYDAMATDQVAKLDKFGGFSKGFLYLMSWTLTAQWKFPPDLSTRDLAKKANAHVPELMARLSSSGPLPNIVSIDFAAPNITIPIIAKYLESRRQAS